MGERPRFDRQRCERLRRDEGLSQDQIAELTLLPTQRLQQLRSAKARLHGLDNTLLGTRDPELRPYREPLTVWQRLVDDWLGETEAEAARACSRSERACSSSTLACSSLALVCAMRRSRSSSSRWMERCWRW